MDVLLRRNCLFPSPRTPELIALTIGSVESDFCTVSACPADRIMLSGVLAPARSRLRSSCLRRLPRFYPALDAAPRGPRSLSPLLTMCSLAQGFPPCATSPSAFVQTLVTNIFAKLGYHNCPLSY